MLTRGSFGARRVNVRAQQRDPDSLLRWFEKLMHTLREAPEIGAGRVPGASTSRCRAPCWPTGSTTDQGSILCLHNLDAEPVPVDLGRQTERGEAPFEVFADGPYDAPGVQLQGLELRPWGYRWLRLRRGQSV